MEYAIKANADNRWYQEVDNYWKGYDNAFNQANEFAEKIGLTKDDVALRSNLLFIKARKGTEHIKQHAKKNLILIGDKPFYELKKNSDLFKKYAERNIKLPSKPMLGLFMLNSMTAKVSYFLTKDFLYVSINDNQGIIPEGFEKIKVSEYYSELEHKSEAQPNDR